MALNSTANERGKFLPINNIVSREIGTLAWPSRDAYSIVIHTDHFANARSAMTNITKVTYFENTDGSSIEFALRQ